MASERQGENFKCLTWMAAGGGEGERSKTKEVKKNAAREKKGKWWFKRETWK